MDLRIVYLFDGDGVHVGSAVMNGAEYVSLTLVDPGTIKSVIVFEELVVKED